LKKRAFDGCVVVAVNYKSTTTAARTASRGNHGEARGGGIEIEHELASANGVGADGAVGVRREIEVGLVAV